MTSRHSKKGQRPFLYRSLASYLRQIYGRPMGKVALDPGFGCPHRDAAGRGGCAFCNPESYVPEHARRHSDVIRQLEAGSRQRRGRGPFIAYLQGGTATNAPPDQLARLLDEIGRCRGVRGIFIGTRPDCVDKAVIEVIRPHLYRRLVWLEMGLQSAVDETLARMGRGHDVSAFVRARELAADAGIPVLAHVILGLPGEGESEMMGTARFLARQRVEGVKIHHLQIIRNTSLEMMYREGQVEVLKWQDYPALVAGFLEHLPPETVIHRLLADAPEHLLIAPRWPGKDQVTGAVQRHMLRWGMWQGRLCPDTGPTPGVSQGDP